MKKKAKQFTVLHLSAVKNWGGGGNHIENLCYELSIAHPEVKNIIMVADGGQFHNRLKNSRFNFSTIPMAMNLDPRAIFKIIQFCRKQKVDLIHIHGSNSLTLAILAHRLWGLPPFVFSKKTSFPIKKRKRTLYKYNHPNIKYILCVSEKVRKVAKEAIVDHNKLKVIYHGTRIDNKSSQTPFTIKDKFGLGPQTRLIGSIGNHIKAKDLETWIDTIDYLINKKKLLHLRFIQIGTFGDQTTSYRKRIELLGLTNFVFFLGYQPQASNFIPQFDLFFLTSKSEGLPQVIYEAFFHKVPVVSTAVGGIPEVIEHEKNGLLSASGDCVTMAEHIEHLLQEPELAQLVAERSFKKLIPMFTAEKMAMDTLKIYKKILHNE